VKEACSAYFFVPHLVDPMPPHRGYHGRSPVMPTGCLGTPHQASLASKQHLGEIEAQLLKPTSHSQAPSRRRHGGSQEARTPRLLASVQPRMPVSPRFYA
jgi:hypothetical protein